MIDLGALVAANIGAIVGVRLVVVLALVLGAGGLVRQVRALGQRLVMSAELSQPFAIVVACPQDLQHPSR